MTILTVKHLNIVDLKTQRRIVKDASFSVQKNSCLGIVGESGSGKTMTVREILGVNPRWIQSEGEIIFEGRNILKDNEKQRRSIRGQKIKMILQDAMTAFNPIEKMGFQMKQTFMQVLRVSRREAERLSLESLKKLNFPDSLAVYKSYPHELSGGMLQRCMIAIALVLKPDIIIADEPTTALDSINQLEVVNQFQSLKEMTGTTLILISHDLGVVQRLADSVIVMKEGEVLEQGSVTDVFNEPKHAYTQYLVSTRLQLSDSFMNTMHSGGIQEYDYGGESSEKL
ncbi:ABC transporter ATP-binding protein [Paenibacillus sp. JZ16]|uniref:ABC transporter ATP-binding protein n=1 Tax=Paenibacillus sp. JZ16 TaxID=1906272 RepID=UPI00188C7DA4|nr:ABC transporter ATP-binding protein [Paenibacillus sp. JZ16]